LKFISDTKWLSLITETYLEGLDAHNWQDHPRGPTIDIFFNFCGGRCRTCWQHP
jgi:hypothetical protein